jgi:hypothetical protein
VTPPGIDPGTVRLVAQCLNHYATPCEKLLASSKGICCVELDTVKSKGRSCVKKQDAQSTYKLTMRCFGVTVIAVESNKYYMLWVCVCSVRYPACSADAPCCHVYCSAVQCFSTLSHKGMIFRTKKNVIQHKVCILIFSITFV